MTRSLHDADQQGREAASPVVVLQPEQPVVPIVVSVPHCGAMFPQELHDVFLPEHVNQPDDTDWFVQRLYDFAPSLGITLIHSRYCRYVIDLNRGPNDAPLYDDGRTLTGLTPATTFLGQPLYRDAPPDAAEVERRLRRYYWPYHNELSANLRRLQERFGHVLLWEAHSIRRRVPTIREEPFPDLILGDQDGTTAHPDLSALAGDMLLQHTSRQIQRNDPFKGGYITRSFGDPTQGIHAIQLEMAKDLYMDDAELTYDHARADQIKHALRLTLKAMAVGLATMRRSS